MTTELRLLILLSASLLQIVLSAKITEAANEKPNIVFFLLDDLGWRDLQCYGSSFYETPNIDRFARQSIRFTQAYAACHVCSPTRASIVSGKYPARLQLTDWLPGRKNFPFQKLKNAEIPQQLPLEEVTLAEALKEHGYRTAHIGKWHLGEEPYGPLQQGFDHQIPRWNKGWPNTGFHAPFELDGLDSQPGDYLTDRLTDEAEKFIEANHDQPFFLYLSHFAVHDPIQGRRDWVAKYREKKGQYPSLQEMPFVFEGNPDDAPKSGSTLPTTTSTSNKEGFKVFSDRTVKIKQHQDNVQFAAMVSSVDESLGRIIAKLSALKLYDKTMIFFFSDNGGMSAANFGRPNRVVANDQLDAAYSTSNLPLRGAKGWLYEGGIRVPMIVYLPANNKVARVCDEPVISTDFYPTILELAGLPLRANQHRDGVSLARLLKGEIESFDRPALYWHFPHYSNHGMQSPCGAIRAGDDKLIEYFEHGTVQLFDLKNDLEEKHDLSSSQPEKVARLREMLHRWRETVGAQMMEPNDEYAPF